MSPPSRPSTSGPSWPLLPPGLPSTRSAREPPFPRGAARGGLWWPCERPPSPGARVSGPLPDTRARRGRCGAGSLTPSPDAGSRGEPGKGTRACGRLKARKPVPPRHAAGRGLQRPVACGWRARSGSCTPASEGPARIVLQAPAPWPVGGSRRHHRCASVPGAARGLASEDGLDACHPRALTCARRSAASVGSASALRPLRSAPFALSSVARLGPGPGPGPRAPHASPPAGAAPQMRLREEEPRGPGSPRAPGRGRGAGRGARGRGPRGCAQNQARIRPGALGCGGPRGPLGARHAAPAAGPGWGRGRAPRLRALRVLLNERLGICGRPSREGRLPERGYTARAAVARELGNPGC